MKKRSFAAVCTMVWLIGACCGAVSAAQRPNVLLVFVDDLRPMTRDYGHPQMKTPNFDRLARSGMRFENAYCQVPTCGASRASLFTSIYPTVERFPNFYTWAERDAPGRPTLPQRFREAGYTTISNGKVFHHQRDTQDRSWSEPAWRPDINGRTFYNDATAEFMETQSDTRRRRNGGRVKKLPMFEPGLVDPLETVDGKIAQKTMDDLERLSEQDSPFFVACGFAKPHMPFYAPAPAWDPYPLGSIDIAAHRERPVPTPNSMRQVREQYAYSFMTPDLDRRLTYNSDAFHKQMRRGYYACVSHADDLLGRILDKLTQLGLDDNTYVLVLGDHGFLLGEHNEWAKNQLLPNALRTAMWMRGPGVAENAAAETHVEFADIYPTLCEAASIEYDAKAINGRSFADVLQKPSSEHRDHAYTRFEQGDAITTDDYYYALWQPAEGKEEALLIDRKKDPQGVHNVSGQAAYADAEAELRQKVLAKIERAGRIDTPVKKVSMAQLRANRSNSPLVQGRSLTLEATLQSPAPEGVVISHGGLLFGYSLHFREGRAVLSVRQERELTELVAERAVAGKFSVTAKLDADSMSLAIDGEQVASMESPGLLNRQPMAKLSIGEDAGDNVGDYEGPNPFQGKILKHDIQATAASEPSAEESESDQG